MRTELRTLLADGGGVIALDAHRAFERLIRRAVERGELVSVLPRVYAASGTEGEFLVRARAVSASDPDAVLTGLAAAHLSGWAEHAAPDIVTAASGRLRNRPGFRFEPRVVPRALTRRVGGIRITSRALTVLDLVPLVGASAIDRGLARSISLDALAAALRLTPGRAGNVERRRLLRESRSTPWSAAERVAHRALFLAGIRLWVANYEVGVDEWTSAFVDIAFKSLRLGIEIDGREHHEGWANTVRAYRRDRALAEQGWLIVRFSAAEVLSDPEAFARAIARLVAARAAQLC